MPRACGAQPIRDPRFSLMMTTSPETTRLTHRVLDLRRPTMQQRNLQLRYQVAMWRCANFSMSMVLLMSRRPC